MHSRPLPKGTTVSTTLAPIASEPVPRPAGSATSSPGRRTDVVRRGSRDPFIDVVRAIGTLGVVLAHWLAPAVTWDGVTLGVDNAFGTGGAWLLTWPLQLLALLFFAAGAAAATSRATSATPPGPWWRLFGSRVQRLARPVGALLAVWAGVLLLGPVLGMPPALAEAGAAIAPQLLWFLGIHLVLLTLAPWLLACYRRDPVRTLAWVLAVPLSIDALHTLGGVPAIGWVNVLAGWAVPFVLGLAWVEHRRTDGAVPRRAVALGTVLALGVAIGLVAAGVFPASMVGLPGAEVSNLAPPTTAAVALGLAQVGIVVLLRERLLVLAARPALTRGVRFLAAHALPIYLWHVSAMLVVVGVVLTATGEGFADPWSVTWWSALPGWLSSCGGTLAVLLRGPGLARSIGPARRRQGSAAGRGRNR